MHQAEDARARWLSSPWLIVVVLVAVYAPSLAGDWIAYDDDWLVRDNPLLNRADPDVLWAIVAGLDRDTRLVLGAEYLPVRDLVTWLARGWLGLDALGFRVLCLGFYAGACALLLRWARTLGRDGFVHATWLFALHPVHAESVAWIAGLKDVLALAFLAGALALHGERSPLRRGGVLVCVFLACGAKGVAVVAPALLAVADLLRGRPQDRPLLLASTVVCAAWAALHAWIGGVVGMFAEPLGGGVIERVASVAVLLLRYVGLSCLASRESVVYEVGPHGLDLAAIGALSVWVGLVGASVWAWRRGQRWPAALLLWFLASLGPVSQLLAPLQNRMADRYLLTAVWAPCAALGLGLESALASTKPAWRRVVLGACGAALGVLSAGRGLLFTDPVALYTEATERTETDARAPLLLADELFLRQRYAEAEDVYRVTLARDQLRTDRSARAGNGLARLLAASSREDEAIALYEQLVARYPEDPRLLHNLAILEQRQGRLEEARRHREELATRFPDYRPSSPTEH
ncbi:MAG: tetratricopeptide repeat protein [Sandaracinaceae bacterium]|nr:tetratricopeptide repeat protein [Sandaracinaceae bacterium]